MGGIINIIIGLGLAFAGMSNALVLRGTNSGPLLALLGGVLVVFGGYQVWRSSR